MGARSTRGLRCRNPASCAVTLLVVPVLVDGLVLLPPGLAFDPVGLGVPAP